MKFTKHNRMDTATGRIITTFGLQGRHVSHLYFTANSWTADSCYLVVSVLQHREDRNSELYRVDKVTGEGVRLLANHMWDIGTVGSDDRYYYYDHHRIQSIDLHTLDIHTIYEDDDSETRFGGPLSITNDNRTLGLIVKREGTAYVSLLDVERGRLQDVTAPKFSDPLPLVTHPMVNPEQDHLIFYCHEGRTDLVSDRIWVANAADSTRTNLFQQRYHMREDRLQLGEWVGHEMWSHDGSQLFFVKYAVSPFGPTGIYAVAADGSRTDFINGDYRYWHVAVSPDGRYAVADTQEWPTMPRIVLIDLHCGRSSWLCHAPSWKKHPSHPHPCFSTDSRTVVFSYMNEEGMLEVALTEVEDLVREG